MGVRPKRIFKYRDGRGVQNGRFGAYALYGWPQIKTDVNMGRKGVRIFDFLSDIPFKWPLCNANNKRQGFV